MSSGTRALLALTLLGAFDTAHAQHKVWQHEDGIQRRVGDVSVTMEKSTNRDAPLNGFVADIRNMKTGVYGVFRGACAEAVNASFTLTDLRKVNLTPYQASRAGKDLPIQDVLDVMRESLAEQCGQLQVLRITVDTPGARQLDIPYQGTLQKSTGWRIADGHVATAFDQAMVFDIRLRDLNSPAGIRFRGKCAAEPTLLLEPQYASASEQATGKPPGIYNYMTVAQGISGRYAQNCPGVKRIRYAIDPMPFRYKCKAGSECFLEASLGAAWNIDASQFEMRDFTQPIVNIDDGTEVLAAGRADILADYSDYFSYYAITWFVAYAEHCAKHIRDPVNRSFRYVKQTKAADGRVINEEFSEPIVIFVEREHVPVYDAHWGGYQGYLLERMFRIALSAQDLGQGGLQMGTRIVGFATDGAGQMRQFMQGSCTNDRVRTVQQNVINHARQQPLVTGKYTTGKKPWVRPTENGSSAPAFTAAYLRERDLADKAAEDERRSTSLASRQRAQNASVPAAAGTAATPASGTATPAPGGTAAQAGVSNYEQLAREHNEALMRASHEYRARLAAASTPQEKRALQTEFQARQSEMQESFTRKMREMQQR